MLCCTEWPSNTGVCFAGADSLQLLTEHTEGGMDVRVRTVVVAGILQVLAEGCKGAKARDGSLGGEAKEGNHGQAGVLHLLLPHLLAAHAQGVERGLVQEAGLQEHQRQV